MSDQIPEVIPQIGGFGLALAGGLLILKAGFAQLRAARLDAGSMERLEKLEKEVGELREKLNAYERRAIEHTRWDYEVVDAAHTAGLTLPPPPTLFPPEETRK